MVPGFESCGYDFSSFSKKDLHFSVSGSFWDGFIDMFKGTYINKIVDAISGIMKKTLTVTIPAEINKMIAETDGKAELPIPKWIFDIRTEEAGIITDKSIYWGTTAILYDSDFNETMPDSFPVMHYKDDTIPSELQAFVSEESVNSLLTSALQVMNIEGWFNATEVPASAPFDLTTGTLGKAFKGMTEMYGDDRPVDIQFAVTKLGKFAVSKDTPDLTAYADVELKFFVETLNETELAVDLTLTDVEYQGNILVENGYNISSNIT